jgi:hypothetical protein
MSASKYLNRDATTGLMTEKVSADVSTGAPDAGRVVALGADGMIDPSMLPTAESIDIVAGEDLDAWDVVEIYNDAGTAKARKASAASATPRAASAFTRSAILTGVVGKVYPEGDLMGQTGLTPGARQYLSETVGMITATPVSGAGKLHQFVGKAISATEVSFDPDDVIVLA